MKQDPPLDLSQRFVLSPRLALQLSIAGFLFIKPEFALADDEIRTSADVTTTGGWSSNPFSEVGHGLGSAYVQVDAKPSVSLVAEHSVIALTGLLDYQHYFRNYPDSYDYGGSLDYAGSQSSRLTTHANAHFDSTIIGGFDAITPVINPTQAQPPVTTSPDLALIGSRERRNTLSFSGDAGYTLSSHDSVTANAYYSQSRYGGAATVSNYHGYGGGAGYSRRISQRFQLGFQASASRYVYKALPGHSRVYSLQATFKNQFSDTWNVTGALGASFSGQSLGGKRTNLTGNLQLCRLSSRATLCLNASDAVLPTGGTGTVNTKSAGASYSYRLSEHSNFSLSASYSHNDRPISTLAIAAVVFGNSYVTATANYDHTLRPRIHLVATTQFRRIMGNAGNYPADFGGSIGISIRFGGYR